jgi:hypothetical protein
MDVGWEKFGCWTAWDVLRHWSFPFVPFVISVGFGEGVRLDVVNLCCGHDEAN